MDKKLSIEWNSTRLGVPAHGIVTKNVYKTLLGVVEIKGWWVGDERGGVLGVQGLCGSRGWFGWGSMVVGPDGGWWF